MDHVKVDVPSGDTFALVTDYAELGSQLNRQFILEGLIAFIIL